MLVQPSGYRDGIEFAADGVYVEQVPELLKSYVGLHAIERGLNLRTDLLDGGAWLPEASTEILQQCPLILLDDSQRWGIPAASARLIPAISQIIERPRFLDRLAGLDPSLRRRWERKKTELRVRLPRHPEFEKLKGTPSGLFSLRLNDNFRVHLRPLPGSVVWEAIEVGTHKELGHG